MDLCQEEQTPGAAEGGTSGGNHLDTVLLSPGFRK